MPTEMTRRALLKKALVGTSLLATSKLTFAKQGISSNSDQLNKKPALIGCARTGEGRFSAVVANDVGDVIRTIALPSRGHGVAVNQASHAAVVFARRPGRFAIVFDYRTGEALVRLTPQPNRFFYGHGCFSNDGNLLYVTEGVENTSEGLVGVYQVNTWQKVAEFSGFGIGPHEIISLSSGSIAVAVGGVRTRGREILNLDSMSPALIVLSPEGQLLSKDSLEQSRLSIRHLACNQNDQIVCAQQFRGEADEYYPLLAIKQGTNPIQPLLADDEHWAQFDYYIGSVAMDNDWILATSPRGNCYGIWSAKDYNLVEIARLSDASGVGVKNGQFFLSSGSGLTQKVTNAELGHRSDSQVQWDNHWTPIT